MKNNYILVDRLSEAIKDVLVEEQLILGEKAEHKIRSEIGLVLFGEKSFLDTKAIGIESDDLYLFIECSNIYKNEKFVADKMNEILIKLEDSFKGMNKLNIYFINYSFSDELSFKNKLAEYGFKKSLEAIIRKEVKRSAQKVKASDLYDLKYLMINKVVEKDYKINIESRIRSLEKILKTKENLTVKGYVFIADLFDIVEVFNDIGNEIFEYNVRLGISDKYDVAKEITKTIKMEPEEFWFLNNGITILIMDDKFSVKKADSITLTYSDNHLISIINGAQTITTAAEVLYNKKDELKSKETAKVMLRIVNIVEKSDESNEGYKEFANKVSLSLNRQKPIAPEDLAFATDFISNINNLWEVNKEDKYTFRIIKRSNRAVTIGVKLEEFTRAIKAFLDQNPGQARSQGGATLIRISSTDTNRYSFVSDVFKVEFSSRESSTIENFYKYYKPVNFAVFLSNYYQTNAEKIKDKIDSREMRGVINYGKWFFIAYVIYVLNYEDNQDFTKFDFDYPESSKIDGCIKKFSEVYKDCIIESKSEFDSNNFKNNIIYERFKKDGIKDGKKLENLKMIIFQTFRNVEVPNFVNYLTRSQVAADKEN